MTRNGIYVSISGYLRSFEDRTCKTGWLLTGQYTSWLLTGQCVEYISGDRVSVLTITVGHHSAESGRCCTFRGLRTESGIVNANPSPDTHRKITNRLQVYTPQMGSPHRANIRSYLSTGHTQIFPTCKDILSPSLWAAYSRALAYSSFPSKQAFNLCPGLTF